MIETARLEMQYRHATARCNTLANAEKWQARLEAEYHDLKLSLEAWAKHRQHWYDARAHELHDQIHERWEKLALRDSYKQARYQLKLKQQRWRDLMQGFSNLQTNAS
jgi:stearoyl-CoA desaturase (delta-9 desaturase)